MKIISNQFPVYAPKKPPSKWVLYAGKQPIIKGDYPLCSWMKNKMQSEGHRFLTVKPVRE